MIVEVERSNRIPTQARRFEMVERKGLGHPDTICDLVADSICVELAKHYMREYGQMMHFNVDKALLAAGETENRFGGGIVKRPMHLIIGDRATFNSLDIDGIVRGTARRWFNENLRHVRDEHVCIEPVLGSASAELRSLFAVASSPLSIPSNDTSALVGYAPSTLLEQVVRETELFINSAPFKHEFPEAGEDVKVMGFRHDESIELTIAIAFVDAYVESESYYFARKRDMLHAIDEHIKDSFDIKHLSVEINTLDREGKGMEGLYLTVLGTSADSSDSGQVGRGNRANGLISLMRPAGSESYAGKNPLSHIGKVYAALCFEIADDLHKSLLDEERDEVVVWMYNRIGKPVGEPMAVVVEVTADTVSIESSVKSIVGEHLNRIDDMYKRLINGTSRLGY
ncbi:MULTISPECIES: methionine adenosyltransferase [Candidatus Nitrosocaldus]|uniref:S-adenosylmethionine synthetase, S-adenosylmethionine synthetase n=1 Tax=Candidatus Nitrosocaldus cavascurensis TaxID=2058097 RepID=A0A2K5AQZ0_9ARCH|nr:MULTISPECIES: methionine adenosyltransferase [Candidatus Nitrosocaldus]SPC34071.1 S-adenosylmethionine synthetase, S-adenosylmethionine synthetase [Candidatus Nitrosocaldus cavascurensis]